MGQQKYRITLPLLAEQPEQDKLRDVVGGRLFRTYDGGEQEPIETANGQAAIDELVIDDGIVVALAFGFADDAGNVSARLEGPSWTVVDTEAPPAPVGSIGVEHVGEV